MKAWWFGLIVLSVAASVLAGDAIPPTTHPDSGEWADLIAPDLSNADFPKGVWTVENQELTASEDQVIWSKKKYRNYILDLEFKTADGTNSGVILHCSDPGNWIPNSIEVQIADDFSEKWATADPTWQCGAIFGHLAPTRSRVKKPGEWNRFTITSQEGTVYVMLNGEQVAVMNMSEWTSAKTNPDGSEIPSWLSKPVAGMKPEGKIGLQGKHAGAPIWFRKVKIRELD
jgi:hypothetical protein